MGSMKLRSYEKRAVRKLKQGFLKHRSIVGVAPTGSGKTVIGAAYVASYQRQNKTKMVLWVAHRVELLRQACSQLKVAGVRGVGIWSGTDKDFDANTRVLVVSVAMLRGNRIPKVGLIVIDECHHVAAKSYVDIIGKNPRAKILGLTATPWRLDGKPLGDAFDHLFVMAEAIELAAEGYIMESLVYGIPRKKAAALVKGLKPSGGDYSARKLEVLLRKQPLMADIIKEWKRLANGKPTIVYACTVDHGADLTKRFRRAGVLCQLLHWGTPDKERQAVLAGLADGKVQVVVNVAILTEGIDCPPVKCIVLARPTKSLTLHRQMCGRASRPSGTGRPVILDHAGNTWRLGLPEMPVEWSLDGRVKMGGEAPVKRCAECGAMCAISAKTCTECGAEFPLTERELKERAAKLERIRLGKAESKRKEMIVRRLAKMRGLGEDWVRAAMGEVG